LAFVQFEFELYQNLSTSNFIRMNVEPEELVRRESIGERIRGVAWSMFHMADKYKIRGMTPERARDVIGYAKRNKETLKDQVVAVGPHFDDGMSRLEEFEKAVEKYDHKWLTDDLQRAWTKTFLDMTSKGFYDIIHAVEASKPVIYGGINDYLMREPQEGYPSQALKQVLHPGESNKGESKPHEKNQGESNA